MISLKELSNSDEISTVFTLEQLANYKGKGETDNIYIAAAGFVFDVTSGSDFYGVGKGYHCFAGNDATVNLAKTTLDPKYLN